MRRVAIAAVGAVLALPGAAQAAAPVEVVSSSTRLERADRADVRVRCNRDRGCRGVLVLEAPCDQRDQPAIDPTCMQPLGVREFALPAHRTRTVGVAPLGVRFTSAADNAVVVRARALLPSRSGGRGVSQRQLTILAPPALRRPRVRPTLSRVDAFGGGDPAVYDLAFEADVPRGTFSAAVAVGGRRAALHPGGAEPFVVSGRSWAPTGVAFHGTLRARRDQLPPHSRQRVRLTGCTIRGCESRVATVDLPGPDDPRPICHIGLGETSAQTRLLAGLPR